MKLENVYKLSATIEFYPPSYRFVDDLRKKMLNRESVEFNGQWYYVHSLNTKLEPMIDPRDIGPLVVTMELVNAH